MGVGGCGERGDAAEQWKSQPLGQTENSMWEREFSGFFSSSTSVNGGSSGGEPEAVAERQTAAGFLFAEFNFVHSPTESRVCFSHEPLLTLTS